MPPFRSILIVLLLFFCSTSFSQSEVKGYIIDSVSGDPVPFVNIQIKGTSRGTIGDLQGLFELKPVSASDILQFSCVGYETRQLAASMFPADGVVRLNSKPVSIAAVTVTPGMNPANEVMRRVVEQAQNHNPDINNDYRCVLYHKMVFSFERPQLLGVSGRQSDFLLIEGVSEKSNKAPSQHSERMISGRVSGFNDPSLAFVPAQIQPFSFYSKDISLLGETYVNPVSAAGLRNYNFILEDTVWSEKADTVLYISFFPRRGTPAKTLRGSLHVEVPSFVVRTVSAATAHADAPIMLSIRQNYRRHENGTWFPEQLESRLRISSPALASPIIASGRSYVANVDFAPVFDRKTFSGPDFTDEGISSDRSMLENYRVMPLNASDSAIITLLDSLNRIRPLDQVITMQRDMLRGFLPLGKINLDIRKLIGFNDYEGFKAGLGLQTNDRLWAKTSVGGYAVYGFSDSEWKYGGNIRRVLKNDGSLSLWGKKDVAETGAFNFLAGSESGTYEYLGGFLIETMDRCDEVGMDLKLRLLRNMEGMVGYSYSDVMPMIPYRFRDDVVPVVANPFDNHEVRFKLKWTPGQRMMKNVFGLFRQNSKLPVMWLNYTIGVGEEENNSLSYRHAEFRIHQDVRLQSWSTTTVRAEMGKLSGDYHDAFLYSAMGTKKKLGLEIPFSFAAMRPNEFGVSQFCNLFFRHQMTPFAGSKGRFKPEVSLLGAAGWSNSSQVYKTYDKGYYEAGLAVDNLWDLVIIKYGFGVHHRFGPYRLNGSDDNWAFNISIKFAL